MQRFFDRPGSVVWLGIILCVAFLVLVFHRGIEPASPAARPLTLIEVTVAVALGAIGLAVIIARRFGRGGRSSQSPSEDERAGFVMDTFQHVLQELKEKETALGRLRAKAEARAERVESYHENILRSIASGVITSDSRGIITTFNVAAERILGLRSGEVIGRPCGQVLGETSPITTMVSRSLEERTHFSRQEWDFLRGTERVCVGLSSALLRDRAETIIGAAVVFTDLTEIKRLEEQVESEHRLSVLGEMSAGIAHEFRNYMGAILGWSKLLAKQLPEGTSGRPMVEAIMHELSIMQHLIDDLLGFGRDLEPQRQPLEFREFLKEATTLRPCRPGIQVGVTIAPAVPHEVEWDLTLMRQALKNLVQNAAEAMPEGGTVTVQVAVADAKPAAIELVVGDTGVGIPAQFMDRIFLPFFTLKATGHGLGLALVHKIVLAHQGSIRVRSHEGAGTTFTLTMPVTGATSTGHRSRLNQAA
ncbi:MAG: PAS domain S-box protein [Nitrospirae bacterium]|nr:PAS domain S-box protein [Nitrospirota bacterium]